MSGHVQPTKPSRNFPKGGWEARYRVNVGGKKKWRAKTFGTKREAQRFLAETVTDIHRGDYIDPTQQQMTFREVAESWLASRHKLRPKTLAGYESTLKTYLLPDWESVRVGDIDYAAVQGWVNAMSRTHSAWTIRGSYQVLRQVLGHAVKMRKLRANPCDRSIERPSIENRERLTLSSTEVEQLADAISYRPATSKHSQPRNRPDLGLYVRFAAYTGLRAGEIGAMRVRHLDLNAGSVSVEEAVSDVAGKLVTGPPKTRNGTRVVPLIPELVDELKAHLGDRRLQPDSYVFQGQHGGQWNHSNFRGRFWKEAVERAGLPEELRFHDLRHTFATWLIDKNVNLAEISRLLGHASISITINIYGHPKTDNPETVAKLSAVRADALKLA